MNILQLNSSARGEASESTRLANRITERVAAANAGAKVTVHDVVRNPIPTLDEAALQAIFTPAEQRSAEQAARVVPADAAIAAVQAADVLVLAVPMYNFGVPAQLKNWIDAIARAGVTFRYTATGPEGLLKGKKVFVALTRGGKYRDTPADSLVPYLRTTLGFLGMTDVQFVYAEGLNMGAEVAQAALQAAEAEIAALELAAAVA
ncbi:NAD(P)H-dependent oxidoreductase [Niveibacterium sp. SC-1]|uniref:FMN-dependent NADH-azoreductase n=1 Tax=Niveibacterium sp. SC-1 TaxID=3135646 RepID=UPI00311DEBC7